MDKKKFPELDMETASRLIARALGHSPHTERIDDDNDAAPIYKHTWASRHEDSILNNENVGDILDADILA